MIFYIQRFLAIMLAVATSTSAIAADELTNLVKFIQPTVATVVAYDANNNVANL